MEELAKLLVANNAELKRLKEDNAKEIASLKAMLRSSLLDLQNQPQPPTARQDSASGRDGNRGQNSFAAKQSDTRTGALDGNASANVSDYPPKTPPKKKPASFIGSSSFRLKKHIALLKKSDLFDAVYYLDQNKDLRSANVNPYLHYCRTGWRESRNPGPDFSTRLYLEANKDVQELNVNPLVHYELYGRAEGRPLRPQPVREKPQPARSRPKAIAPPNKRFDAPEIENTIPNAAIAAPKNAIVDSGLTKTHGIDEELAFGPVLSPEWQKQIELLGLIDDGGTSLRQELPGAARRLAMAILAKSPPTVSVIMPTWNRVKVIDKAIASILNQEHLPTEVIIVDDGSTDGTLEHLRSSYPELLENGFIKLIEGQHAGVSAARNLGLEAASGELIAYLDSDNTWRPDFLMAMVALFASSDELQTAYAGLAGSDAIKETTFVRASRYDRKRLLQNNFIDLNVFIHTRHLYRQFGGFDTTLKRLVDWDLIIRHTRLHEPAYVPIVGVDYYLGNGLDNITTTIPLDENRRRVLLKHAGERLRMGLETLRLAYIIYDFQALSQTFVTNEVRWLVENGVDVVAYHMIDPDKFADFDFPIRKVRVSSAEELRDCLARDDRNLCHSHFVYPTVTNFVWPACEALGIPFTVFPHAVDLFHENNVERNRIQDLAKSEQCLKIFVYGDHHRDFLISRGVPQNKIAYNFQVPGLVETGAAPARPRQTPASPKKRGIVIARFIEKKGISYLIDAVAKLDRNYRSKLEIDIFGYGPEEESYVQSIAAAGLESVIKLRGPIVSPEALQTVYESADFLCAPCVVAKNGDRDGFPTVILDAINEGIPVITTAVSGIPDYLTDGIEAIVVEPRDSDACADGLRRLIDMPPQQSASMIHRAQQFANAKVNLENTIKVYMDHWLNRPIDLFMVTYNTEKYEDSVSTLEIIRRVGEHTTTPYTLTIVDNDSDEDFKQKLRDVAAEDQNIRLLLKQENLFCGPGSNIAIHRGDAKYAVYICSKEGFIMRHGWERPLMHFMEVNEDVGQAGHLCHLPRATYGHELSNIQEFPKFRNQAFARANPNRPFKHAQGGCFIVRRNVFVDFGGFNNEIPQNNMDVEFSYMLESEGWRVAKIPDMISLSIKTLPSLGAQFNERTAIIHPSNYDECTTELDVWRSGLIKHRCNLCGWTGDQFATGGDDRRICTGCKSDGLDRLVYAALASDHRAHRRERFAGLLKGTALSHALGQRMFQEHALTNDPEDLLSKLRDAQESLILVVIDRDLVPRDVESAKRFWRIVAGSLKPDGKILLTDEKFQDRPDDLELPESFAHNAEISLLDLSSQLSAYDWRRLVEVVRVGS